MNSLAYPVRRSIVSLVLALSGLVYTAVSFKKEAEINSNAILAKCLQCVVLQSIMNTLHLMHEWNHNASNTRIGSSSIPACRVSFTGAGGAFSPLDFYLPPFGNLKLIPIDKGCVNYNCNTMHKTVHKYNYMSHNNPSMLSIPYVYDIF